MSELEQTNQIPIPCCVAINNAIGQFQLELAQIVTQGGLNINAAFPSPPNPAGTASTRTD